MAGVASRCHWPLDAHLKNISCAHAFTLQSCLGNTWNGRTNWIRFLFCMKTVVPTISKSVSTLYIYFLCVQWVLGSADIFLVLYARHLRILCVVVKCYINTIWLNDLRKVVEFMVLEGRWCHAQHGTITPGKKKLGHFLHQADPSAASELSVPIMRHLSVSINQ